MERSSGTQPADLDRRVPEWKKLRELARAARGKAYCPYSQYQVGAAVLARSGQIVAGCNVENASFGLTICAERAAVCAAVSQGFTELVAVCVSLTGTPVPCGACRQFLHEFNAEMLVVLDDLSQPEDSLPELVQLSELLPRAFHLER